MIKKITLMLTALLVFSFSSVFAANSNYSIYDKDEKIFVQEFNNAAKNFGFKIKELKYLEDHNGGVAYGAEIDGLKDVDAFINTNSSGKVSSIIFIADNKDSAEKLFNSTVATLQINAPYQDSIAKVVMKTATNKNVKVDVSVNDGVKGKVYLLMFAQ